MLKASIMVIFGNTVQNDLMPVFVCRGAAPCYRSGCCPEVGAEGLGCPVAFSVV